MARTAADALEVDRDKVFLKRRQRQCGTRQHERVNDEKPPICCPRRGDLNSRSTCPTTSTRGCSSTIALPDPWYAKKQKASVFLNLFGYTGAFTVYAAAGGAESTATVDLSKTYLDWARQNLILNDLDGPSHRFIRSDTMEYLNHLPEKPCFDLAVVDPPTFSNSKRTEEVWDIQRDHVPLLKAVIQRVAPGGIVYFSTNFRRFKLSEADLDGVTIREISRQTVPPDFRNRRIHRCWRLVRTEALGP